MGGEKLRVRKNFFAAAVLAAAGLVFILSPLSAQNQEPSQGLSSPVQAESQTRFPAENQAQLPAEESMVLGESVPAVSGGGTASGWIMLRMVLALALAALAIYGVVFFIKRLARPPEARDPHLKVLASAPLGNGTFAAVVSIGSKAWLVGGGEGGVSLIAEIDEQEALESMLVDDAAKAEVRPGRFPDFRSLLRKLGGAGQGGQLNSHAETLRKQRERLKGL